MTYTNHQIKYFAWEITKKRSASDVDRLSQSLFDAQVDVNPHQIEAALFALNNPLSKGVILADEVGLGKTIEAALVLCQYWAERRRNLLIICPASLRKQWAQELQDKFNLPTQVLDLKTWNMARKDGVYDPFKNGKISIISYPFANRMEYALAQIPWDLVVIDEAHKLRNAHRSSNKIGNSLKRSLIGKKKLLLTATPLQNTLMELYGLSTIIDEHLFGDEKAFRSRYVVDGDIQSLKKRIQQFMQRTLRKDVLEYVPYTNRHALTVPFKPNDDEQSLYDSISEYLQREVSYAFPQQQKHLISIVLRKLLASSTPAVIATLEAIQQRLKKLLEQQSLDEDWLSNFIVDEDMDEELLDDFDEEVSHGQIDVSLIKSEIAEIERYIQQAYKITDDSKTFALLSAIEQGFARMFEMGAKRKAVIFTESKRTQEYLIAFLEARGYKGKVIGFNGSNTSATNTGIYQKWLGKYLGTQHVTGSPAIDRRTALIDFFKNEAEILIATEAAAEGVNLQFCSLVINYDLPWNPQRVEQRIGRCHRYGQEFDVVVVNFLNERNEADQRVLELLKDKFQLFDGVFGASNDILGTVESGINFEKRISEIYDQCRSPEEIEQSFKQLRDELEEQINVKMKRTQELLLEHFDADIHDLLKVQKERAELQLDKISRLFWLSTKYILGKFANFHDQDLSFDLTKSPILNAPSGKYQLIRKGERIPENTFIYRLTHPLGEFVLDNAKGLQTPKQFIQFDYSRYGQKVTLLEELKGQKGWLSITVLSLDSFQEEEHIVITAMTDDGKVLDVDLCERLLQVNATVLSDVVDPIPDLFQANIDKQYQVALNHALELNDEFFKKERDKLEQWAEDSLLAVEKMLEDVKLKISSLKRESRKAPDIETEKKLQEEIQKTEKEKRRMRQQVFDVEDEIADKRDAMIDALEQRLHRSSKAENLFAVRWQLV
ncbi:DEAD/DEAH box helicase [Acinetobacter cumulans]|uniref:SNF2-related protein n=1 Tax=Acinetobacter cumulans TaxID=2136182 RepID=UPI000EA05A5E|nr:SNF2-related protein [Acinetobacter cumulans]RKG45110.1 DEAD/DEAH box helicase [Acinetobacter cumulans]